jgi:isoamylase
MTLQAIDVYPTHHEHGYDLRVGRPFPFGATTVPGGVNFSVFSSAATSCTLVLFDKGCPQPKAEITFPAGFRIGHTWAMTVFNLDVETMEYGYRMDGPWNPGQGHRFDSSKILLDPYARAIGGRDVWGVEPDWSNIFPHRGRVVFEDFEWEGDRPLETPIEDLVVYKAHARGLTRDPSSGVRFPGSFGGIREKIPYLKELGIKLSRAAAHIRVRRVREQPHP